jgi:transcription factor IIIB subunit 2
MSSSRKCKSCGSSDIEVDPARGDAVCTNCGSVLEVNIIVAEVQFEEGTHGTNSAIGQFVSADSKGGATKFGASFHVGTGIESREMTLRKARNGITQLCNQLQLNQHCIDTACNFFKMALNRNLTKGRKNTHVHAACVYLTCRTEGTAHLLIDISDVLQICCYELGRTYLKLSQALSINIPAVDPCLYILRFAAKLEFGGKTQQVANTALRLVQRMKRDSIHSGRRPSGLCGAALLIAARLHEFGRSASDIVKIVKVHESTLRKRLIEFGDTPSSALTLEEFMTVDLEEEQDPPSFKAARKKDKERLQRLMEEEAESITELQQEIEMQLNRNARMKCRKKKDRSAEEIQETNRFIQESTLGTINQIIQEEAIDDPDNVKEPVKELGPDIASMGLASSLDDTSNAVQPPLPLEVDLTFDDIDDEELESYIMSEHESQNKNAIWLKRNAAFLEEQKSKWCYIIEMHY